MKRIFLSIIVTALFISAGGSLLGNSPLPIERQRTFATKSRGPIIGKPTKFDGKNLIIETFDQKVTSVPVADLAADDRAYAKGFYEATILRLSLEAKPRRIESTITARGTSSTDVENEHRDPLILKTSSGRMKDEEWAFDLKLQNKSSRPAGPFKLRYLQFAERIEHQRGTSVRSERNVGLQIEKAEVEIPQLKPLAHVMVPTKAQTLKFSSDRSSATDSRGKSFLQVERSGDLDSVWVTLTDERGIIVWEYLGPGPMANRYREQMLLSSRPPWVYHGPAPEQGRTRVK